MRRKENTCTEQPVRSGQSPNKQFCEGTRKGPPSEGRGNERLEQPAASDCDEKAHHSQARRAWEAVLRTPPVRAGALSQRDDAQGGSWGAATRRASPPTCHKKNYNGVGLLFLGKNSGMGTGTGKGGEKNFSVIGGDAMMAACFICWGVAKR